MADQHLYRITRPFFAANRVTHARGSVLPFPPTKDGKRTAPSSALAVGTKEEKAFAEKIGVAEQPVEDAPKALSEMEPQTELDLENVEGKAISEVAGSAKPASKGKK